MSELNPDTLSPDAFDSTTTFEHHEPSLAEASAQKALALACLVNSSDTFEQLLGHCLDAEKIRQNSLTLAWALLGALAPDHHYTAAELEQLTELNLQVLALETRIQAALGVLNDEEMKLVISVTSQLLKGEAILPRYRLAELVMTETEHLLLVWYC
ncbi:hypothetical protein [Pseudomonas sp. KNUC1026]|uniref:hypothetical protein n=1 Tax=Pseudomonas sp. KNUC1026 TaxID=2893890 RepID=UPI001F2D0C31|nr:hypothetical protein [Pseudomonas sp. KNUC1026]UFH50270.1 hypothetical protein LN139_02905 [Pseudomonas sp. KNUC1026]